jgi:hypothetical protein
MAPRTLLLALLLTALGCNSTATVQAAPVNVTGASGGGDTNVSVGGHTATAEGARPQTSFTVPVAVAPGSNAAAGGGITTTPAATTDAGVDGAGG